MTYNIPYPVKNPTSADTIAAALKTFRRNAGSETSVFLALNQLARIAAYCELPTNEDFWIMEEMVQKYKSTNDLYFAWTERCYNSHPTSTSCIRNCGGGSMLP